MRGSRSQLARAFEEFKAIPFPKSSQYEAAAKLHAELVALDSLVASQVEMILAGARPDRERLAVDETLRRRLKELADDENANYASDAREYLRYLEAIVCLQELARGHKQH